MEAATPDARGRGGIRILDLSQAPGEKLAWDKPRSVVYMWAIVELLFVYNPWQISSSIRVKALRLFGADIGADVIFRPRTRVKFPWKLHISDRCWIGEGVWLHNQDDIFVGTDVVISQDAFLTTGSHAVRKDMGLITRPINVEAGAWITARCIVLGGASIGRSAIVTPNTVVRSGVVVPEGVIFGQPDAEVLGDRFPPRSEAAAESDATHE
ncbi:acetyltransferase [Arthrobacter sp. ISL-48]|uniref:acetyltransferase n=1 Tax=Arthrobacter sp. ISL-48 TaxID=2819110 RepID=UPI001BE54597|nr:acetyltransferase [Arthrobacter sp. ISL-48]MBT2533316.1 acetyltransferase [Arthrobacter sp. ISL-48]